MQNHFAEVLENCCNYDFIVNYDISCSDNLSQGLIKFYIDYVFFNWSSSENIKLLDTIIFTYITDNNFNEYIHNKYLETNDFLFVYEVLLKYYNDYEYTKIKMYNNTIWI